MPTCPINWISTIDAIQNCIGHNERMSSFYLKGREPNHSKFKVRTDDDNMLYIQETGNSAYHQGGTCKMGSDVMSVVDERLWVRGIERLRVIDGSVMPKLTSVNTNAPNLMIGVKGGDTIRKDAVSRRAL